jgi:hypothetical protein
MSIFTDHNKTTRNTVPELYGKGSYAICESYCYFLVLSKADFYPFTVSDASRTATIKKCLYLRHCTLDLPTQSPLPPPVHCYLSEDIQQLCLTVTINDMQKIHTVIYLLFLNSVTSDWCLAPNRRGLDITHSDAPQSVGFLWTDEW